MDQIPAALYEFDEDYKLLYVNKHFSGTFGYEREQLLDYGYKRMLVPGDDKLMVDMMLEAKKFGKYYRRKATYFHRDGS